MARKRRFIIDIDEETNKKRLVWSDIFLLIIFGLLLALIVILTLNIMKRKDAANTEYSDLVIPVLKQKSSNEMSIDLSQIDDKEYTIKVTNYRNDIINENEIRYSIEVENTNNISIEIYKNEIKKNLADDNGNFTIENNTLGAKKKQEDIYKIIVTDQRKLSTKDVLKINITS